MQKLFRLLRRNNSAGPKALRASFRAVLVIACIGFAEAIFIFPHTTVGKERLTQLRETMNQLRQQDVCKKALDEGTRLANLQMDPTADPHRRPEETILEQERAAPANLAIMDRQDRLVEAACPQFREEIHRHSKRGSRPKTVRQTHSPLR